MKKLKVVLVDFEDSFTFNIASEVVAIGFEVEVVHYTDIQKKLESSPIDFITLFGPGPGHPDDYQQLYSLIRSYYIETKNLFMGICLGHQLFWRAKGLGISTSLNQMHGECESLKLPKWNIFEEKYWERRFEVQRYNSLIVNHTPDVKRDYIYLSDSGEFLMSSFENIITYQFHPESVGTSFPGVFFGALLKLGYNNMDERTD